MAPELDPGLVPIDARALLGDGRSAALLTPEGEIDWWCAPRFDSPPVFDAILDPGGASFALAGRGMEPDRFAYVPGTLATRTEWRSPHARLVVEDWMHYPPPDGASEILRLARCTEGSCVVDLRMRTRAPLRVDATHPALAHGDGAVELAEGEALAMRVRMGEAGGDLTVEEARASLERTLAEWRGWLALARPDPSPAVARSLLTLKALTYAPTGAIVAAPTTSLPETLGGERNWDYRYAWVRDTALCAAAFAAWGFRAEARRLGAWVLHTLHRHKEAHHALYALDGEEAPDEREAPLPGFAESRPVRFGNGAVRQVQHDAYGHAIECLDHSGALEEPTRGLAWDIVSDLAHHAARNWRAPDNGIWEMPAGERRFTYSRMMCWRALDRAVVLARDRGLPGEVDAWSRERDAIHARLLALAREGGGALPQAEEARGPDAANVRASLIGFLPGEHEVARATLAQVRAELEPGPGLVLRYTIPDGLPGREGAFLACSFWLAAALHDAGEADEARRAFAAAEATAGPLGLFPEERDPATGVALGNYPQAIVHAAHAEAAARLAGEPNGAPRG